MLIVNKFVGKFGLSLAHTNCIRMSVDGVNLMENCRVVRNIAHTRKKKHSNPITFVNSITLPAAAVANEIAIIRISNPTIIPPGVPSNWLSAVKLED